MQFHESFFARKFGVTERDLDRYLGEALSAAAITPTYILNTWSPLPSVIDESIVKSATQGVSLGVGIRVIAGERTGYAYSDDLSPEKSRKRRAWRPASQRVPHGREDWLSNGHKRDLYPVLTAPTETPSG